jgi:hypothetical protein
VLPAGVAARAHAGIGPDQPLAQVGQTGALATTACQQFLTEQLLGAPHQAPGVPVRQAQLAAGLRDAAPGLHGRQQLQQGVGFQWRVAVVQADAPARGQLICSTWVHLKYVETNIL